MRMRRARAAVLLAAAFLGAGGLAGAQTAPTPRPTLPAPPPPKKGAKIVPLDFAGVWAIDVKASQGVSTSMSKAVLAIRQSGDHLWIDPIEQPRPYLSADEIVVDGRLYEKAVGRGDKGTVQAQWGKDRKSLWIQTVTKNAEGTEVAFQRSRWELRDGGNTWTRKTWTVQKGQTRESFLVFRKRPGEKPPEH